MPNQAGCSVPDQAGCAGRAGESGARAAAGRGRARGGGQGRGRARRGPRGGDGPGAHRRTRRRGRAAGAAGALPGRAGPRARRHAARARRARRRHWCALHLFLVRCSVTSVHARDSVHEWRPPSPCACVLRRLCRLAACAAPASDPLHLDCMCAAACKTSFSPWHSDTQGMCFQCGPAQAASRPPEQRRPAPYMLQACSAAGRPGPTMARARARPAARL
jgi:hypothetical protein